MKEFNRILDWSQINFKDLIILDGSFDLHVLDLQAIQIIKTFSLTQDHPLRKMDIEDLERIKVSPTSIAFGSKLFCTRTSAEHCLEPGAEVVRLQSNSMLYKTRNDRLRLAANPFSKELSALSDRVKYTMKEVHQLSS